MLVHVNLQAAQRAQAAPRELSLLASQSKRLLGYFLTSNIRVLVSTLNSLRRVDDLRRCRISRLFNVADVGYCLRRVEDT